MEKLGSVDPQRIGAYRLLGRLGAGGMGQVYLARSDRGRTVAIKLVREELAEQQEFRDRFRREVMAARRLGSSWTAPVLDADTDANVPWVATGYIAGPSLQTTVSGRTIISAGPAPARTGHCRNARSTSWATVSRTPCGPSTPPGSSTATSSRPTSC